MVSKQVIDLIKIGLQGSAEKQLKVFNKHWYWKILKFKIWIREIFIQFNKIIYLLTKRDMKEKSIETAILNYIRMQGGWCEALQSGSIMVNKGPYKNKMNLCSKGTPDIICLYNGKFYGIEVKKNKEEVDKWYDLEKRYNEEGSLPKSYDRELGQIEHKKRIIENGGIHIVSWELSEIINLIFNNK